MNCYKAMYLLLFNEVTDAINILMEVQKKTEALFIDSAGEYKATATVLSDPHMAQTQKHGHYRIKGRVNHKYKQD